MSLSELIDAAYAFAIDTIHMEGVSRMTVIERFEEELATPVPGELSGDEMERMRRQRVARENAGATDRLRAMMGMERGRYG